MATLMLTLNQKNRTRFRNQLIKPLIKTGLIELTIPDKPTSSKQRYKTTIKGFKIIDEIKKKKTSDITVNGPISYVKLCTVSGVAVDPCIGY